MSGTLPLGMNGSQPYVCTACRLGSHARCKDQACWCWASDHVPDDPEDDAA